LLVRTGALHFGPEGHPDLEAVRQAARRHDHDRARVLVRRAVMMLDALVSEARRAQRLGHLFDWLHALTRTADQ
jgi:hypothetical protein